MSSPGPVWAWLGVMEPVKWTFGSRLIGVTALLLVLGLPAPTIAAGPYDPDTHWEALRTERFEVVYPAGYGSLAARAARIGEDLWPDFARRYRWRPPGRITIVLDDQTDFANGSARVLPGRIITIFLTAPIRTTGLEAHDDWLFLVIAHELAHIFHIDMAYGLAGLGRQLLGQYVSMNGYAAAWSTEGLAVYEETMSTGSGRGRSTYVDMVLRMAALAGRFPQVDQAYRAYPRWPFGNVAYFFGGRFHLWLEERYGEEALFDYHRAYAANPIPYLTILPAEIHLGASIEAQWSGFRETATEDARQAAKRIEEGRPRREPRPVRLTFHGGESVGPRFTPDGTRIVFSASSPVDGPRVRSIPATGGKERILLDDTLSQAVAFTPDGSAFYFQQTQINRRFYRHDKLLRYDRDEDEVEEVVLAEGFESFLAPSGALRARDPDVHPDGRHVVFVQTHRAMNRLVLAELEDGGRRIRPRVLVPGQPDVQLASPRFSPSGDLIALSRFAGGRRDIVLYDRTGRVVAEVTRDRAQDVDPSWSPDGRWLIFSSDRSRVYDLYALDVEVGEVRRLTHLVGGAFQPSVAPDGSTLVFRGYSADGFDVYRMSFEPEAAPLVDLERSPPVPIDDRPRVYPPRRASAPRPPPPAEAPGPSHRLDPTELPEGWTVGDYDPIPTLFPVGVAWNLLPSVVASERELRLSLTHFGQDALQTHSYALTLRYGTFTEFLGGSASYFNDTLEPTFGVGANADAVTFARSAFVPTDERGTGCAFGGLARTVDGDPVCFATSGGLYVERRLSGTLSMALPLRQRHLLSVAYTFENRGPLSNLAPGTIEGFLPPSGNYARVTLGYAYANVRRFPYSVSLERGPSFSVALSALSKGLGSDFEQIVVTTDGRYYWDLPWADNHVLALRLTAGIAGGPDLAERFRVGGSAGAGVLSVTTQNFRPLRGLAPAVLTGTGQISGTVEYRLPVFRVDRGPGTFPFTLSVVHAAAFVDAGRTFDGLDELADEALGDTLAASVGAELRADALLAFVAPVTLRLGVAWPFALPAELERERDTEEIFFQLGSAF